MFLISGIRQMLQSTFCRPNLRRPYPTDSFEAYNISDSDISIF